MFSSSVGRMRPIIATGAVTLLAVSASVAHAATAADPSPSCAALASYKASSVATQLDNAEVIAPGTVSEWPWRTPSNALMFNNLRHHRGVEIRTPICRVTGVIRPTKASHINFEVWLPLTAAAWNGKFMGTADGGSTGSINYQSMDEPLRRGYAVMGHDNGHVSKSVYETSWAIDAATKELKKEVIVDFGHRAQHVVTVVSKEITQAYYGSAPKLSYYQGCSQGGHHGMMSVQRNPEDYDGAIAGGHGGDWISMLASEAWSAVAMQKTWRLSELQAQALHNAVLEACDAKDGLADGRIEEPDKCRFDPAPLSCSVDGADLAHCLNERQLQAVREIYDGARNRRGQALAPGFPLGSEQYWVGGGPMGNTGPGSYYDFFRLMLKRDPNFDLRDIDWDKDVDAARAQFGGMLDAVDPDLAKFRARKGKFIFYHGWGDALITANISVNYWRRLRERMGDAALDEFVRFYAIPGMSHCGGGISQVDWLTTLENWVEKGVAPDSTTPENTVIATGLWQGVQQSRPVCPYPGYAKYRGAGDVKSASSFVCVRPENAAGGN